MSLGWEYDRKRWTPEGLNSTTREYISGAALASIFSGAATAEGYILPLTHPDRSWTLLQTQ